jgi:hypothetical protein
MLVRGAQSVPVVGDNRATLRSQTSGDTPRADTRIEDNAADVRLVVEQSASLPGRSFVKIVQMSHVLLENFFDGSRATFYVKILSAWQCRNLPSS